MILPISYLLILKLSLSCTTLLAGKKATLDGSILGSTSADAEAGFDTRLMLVPSSNAT
jgi:dipeptidase